MFNIKEKIEEIVEKLKNDDDLLEQFNKNPAKVIEEYVGVDLPDDKVNQLVATTESGNTSFFRLLQL